MDPKKNTGAAGITEKGEAVVNAKVGFPVKIKTALSLNQCQNDAERGNYC